MQVAKVIEYITEWLKDYKAENPNVKGFVVGVSGGIDSALVSTLCARTGIPLIVLELPIRQLKDEVQRSTNHIAWLKQQFGDTVKSHSIDLTDAFQGLKKTLTAADSDGDTNMALANARSRLRMVTLYYIAQLHDYIVVGTGNKVEDFGIGFYTKYGDGGVDISPIADLLKSEVGALAKHLGIAKDILDARPTAGLFDDGRTDQDEIGATYDQLERVMKLKDSAKELDAAWPDEDRKVWEIYEQRNKANQHKMREIPICRIPAELKK